MYRVQGAMRDTYYADQEEPRRQSNLVSTYSRQLLRQQMLDIHDTVRYTVHTTEIRNQLMLYPKYNLEIKLDPRQISFIHDRGASAGYYLWQRAGVNIWISFFICRLHYVLSELSLKITGLALFFHFSANDISSKRYPPMSVATGEVLMENSRISGLS